MASVSIDALIIFIVSLIVAASVGGTMYAGTNHVMGSVKKRVNGLSTDINTQISIISDAGVSGSIYNNSTNTVTVLVKNTGHHTIDNNTKQVDVLVDGQYVSNKSLTVIQGGKWQPDNVARITFTHQLSPGEHRIEVICHGDKRVLKFYV